MKFLSILAFTGPILITLIFSITLQAAESPTQKVESESSVLWATSVHNKLIDDAFPDEDKACRLQMQAGSIYADSWDYQGEAFTHMHAMRTEEQTPQEAEKKMWEHIRKTYEEVRANYKKYNADKMKVHRKLNACFKRGLALHSIMDSTSPSHSGFKIWNPCDVVTAVFDHGNVRENVEELLGIGLGVPHSHEDMSALEANEHLKRDTIAMMRKVDGALRVKDQAFILKTHKKAK